MSPVFDDGPAPPAGGGADPAPDAASRGLGDMSGAEFRRHAAAAVAWVARYLDDPGAWPVLPAVAPGALRAPLPPPAPRPAVASEDHLADFERLVPATTMHWNHPGFFGYFSISASGAGVIAELLTAALNVNAMLWRTGPAATELEEVTTGWLRDALGLPAAFEGTINDTASLSTLHALAAARELHPSLRIREEGLAGRPDVPRLRVYCSEDAHSSVDKAAITLGLGMAGVRHVAVDGARRMRPDALSAAIDADRAAGVLPLAIVATSGTTSTTAVDPIPAIAGIAAEAGAWLHVDASYAGSAALVPELRWVLDGAAHADSIVVNPHKWLFVPIDCSVLYTRRPELLRRAFSLVPEYLTTPGAADARNLMDYGVALGRRFRALKLWFVLRAFGIDGIAARLREHVRLAREFAAWVDATPDFEQVAPTALSLVVFRHRPAGVTDPDVLAAHNAAVLERVNATGAVLLSHTRVGDAYALRLAIGNLRTEARHVRRAWDLVRAAAAESTAAPRRPRQRP